MFGPEITEENLFQVAEAIINQTNTCAFITGKAGTGKSTFIKHVVDTSNKNIVVVAPTGIAAINVQGSTIHSFFGLPLRNMIPDDPHITLMSKFHPKRKIIASADTIIIDEVSMVRVDMIDAIDASLRKNGGNPNLPFGGKQMIFIGDLFQLEPVVDQSADDDVQLHEYYKSPFFFDAQVFNKCELLKIEFKKVFRQTDDKFIRLLDTIRSGDPNIEDLQLLNMRHFPEIGSIEHYYTITLTARNDTAFQINHIQMENIKSKVHRYIGLIEKEFPENRIPVPKELFLKVGCQVMFIRNDVDKKFVNGTIGKITELNDDFIKVLLNDGQEIEVKPIAWEHKEYTLNQSEFKIEQVTKGTYKQYPLALAWAVTIHKSQGLTFDKVIIDLGKGGAFAAGQTYVALSRCRTLEGIYLKNKIQPRDIILNPVVLEFSQGCNNFREIQGVLEEGRQLFLPEFNQRLARRRKSASK